MSLTKSKLDVFQESECADMALAILDYSGSQSPDKSPFDENFIRLHANQKANKCVTLLEEILCTGLDRTQVPYISLVAMGERPQDVALANKIAGMLSHTEFSALASRIKSSQLTVADLETRWPDQEVNEKWLTPSPLRPTKIMSFQKKPIKLTHNKVFVGNNVVKPGYCIEDNYSKTINARDWFQFDIQNALVFYLRGNSVILDSDSRPVEDLCNPRFKLLFLSPLFMSAKRLSQNLPRLENALHVQDCIFNRNFCHWILDTLPRIQALDSDSHLLLANADASFIQETLESLKITQNRVVEFENMPILHINWLRCDTSVTKDFQHPIQMGSPPLVRYIRNCFLQGTEVPHLALQRRLYISRNRSERRTIENEQEITPILESYGIEHIFLEEMKVEEQAILFSQASFVFAPHGAGLSNIVFSNKICVLEIFHPNYGTPTFYFLASVLGHDYYSFTGTGNPISQEERQKLGNGFYQKENITIDANVLDSHLGQLLN